MLKYWRQKAYSEALYFIGNFQLGRNVTTEKSVPKYFFLPTIQVLIFFSQTIQHICQNAHKRYQ